VVQINRLVPGLGGRLSTDIGRSLYPTTMAGHAPHLPLAILVGIVSTDISPGVEATLQIIYLDRNRGHDFLLIIYG
jgi:hypothetical protein